MAMIRQDWNNDYGPFGKSPRSREEYEYMQQKMMYEMQLAYQPPPVHAPEAKKPSHLNQKLLLTTKG